MLAVFFGFVSQTLAGVVFVGQSEFGLTTKTELFNEAVDYTNAMDHPLTDYSGSLVIVGTKRDYAFGVTGVTLTSPIPNINGKNLPIISDMNGSQTWSFRDYGTVMEGSGKIPGGTGAKFLFETGSSSTHFAPYVLTFPGDGALRVGGDWIMSGGGVGHNSSLDRIVVTAYGTAGNLLGTVYIPATTVSNWANNFWAFQATDGSAIKSIGIDYSTNFGAGNPGVANLKFEPWRQPQQWSGASGSNSWKVGNNWGGVAVSEGGHLKFGPLAQGGHSANFNDFPSNTQFNDIIFLPGAPSYNLQGNDIKLDSNIINQSGVNQQISIGMQLVNGVTFDDGGQTITVNGAISGNGPLVKNGSGTVELKGLLDNFAGNAIVNDGTLIFNNGGSTTLDSLTGNGNVVVSDGCMLTVDYAVLSSLTVGSGELLLPPDMIQGSPPLAQQGTSVPEPASAILLAFAALCAVAVFYRKSFKGQKP